MPKKILSNDLKLSIRKASVNINKTKKKIRKQKIFLDIFYFYVEKFN